MTSTLKIQPVIMSGGSGTRLWPMSRKAKPKQFLPLVTHETMLQETAKRCDPRIDRCFSAPLVICGRAHIDHIREQLSAVGLSPAAIITEPAPRNTAAVAAVAAAWTQMHNNGALVLLAPADHHIADAGGFRDAVKKGAKAAADGAIVTFGIKPATPETGFGYIERAEEIAPSVFRVNAFKEKPTRDVADEYLAQGDYFWNAGIFLFDAASMERELGLHAPLILDHASRALTAAAIEGDVTNLDPKIFEQCPADSIDFAVMERTSRAAVVAPVDVGWTDIGSWAASTGETDQRLVTMIDCDNTIVKTDGAFVGVIGVDDLVIVATKDAVLVAPRERAQEVKRIVEGLQKKNRDDLL